MAKGSQSGTQVRRPVHVIKCGFVGGSIWCNTGDHGPWYAVTLSRAFKGTDDKWAYSESFNHSDLLEASLVLQRCYLWIAQQRARDREDRQQGAADGTGTNPNGAKGSNYVSDEEIPF